MENPLKIKTESKSPVKIRKLYIIVEAFFEAKKLNKREKFIKAKNIPKDVSMISD